MANVSDWKFVEFHVYCPLCEHKDKDDTEYPCYTCLMAPVNLNSHKPVQFKEK